MVYIHNAKVVLETGILFDGAILLDGDRIATVGERRELAAPEGCEMIDAGGAYVGPGFVDIHVHGGNGYMFDSEPLQAAEHFLKNGETTILATLYYNLSKEGFLEAIGKVKEAMAAGGAGDAIAGIYMEGPYMNPKFGAMPERNKWKGAIQEEAYKEVVDTVGTDAFVWSVAPEREGIEEFVKYAGSVNPHAIFAVGHSEASPQDIEKLMPYGLCIGTHHTNATGDCPMYPECRGVCVDEAVNYNREIYAEMICDSRGIHVDPYMQRLIRKVKGEDRLILISDCSTDDGPVPEGYEGVTDIVFDNSGEISGFAGTVSVACRNMMVHTGASIVDVFRYGSTNPCNAVGFTDRGRIAKGLRADLVICDHWMNIQNVILKGKKVI